MKKKLIALSLILILAFSCVACGVDYEKKGYEDMKAQIALEEAQSIAEQGETNYRASMQLAISLFGRDIINMAFNIDPAELTGGDYDNMTTEQKTEYLNGAKRAMDEWIDTFVVATDTQTESAN